MKTVKIGVFGSSSGEDSKKEELKQKAHEIGREIARNQGLVVTGACNGLPQEAVLGCSELKGKCIGFSPCSNFENHKKQNLPVEGFSDIIFVPENYLHINNIHVCRKYRNVSSVAFCDVCIFISGRIGTMNEFTNAYDMGKVIGILENSGGISRVVKILLQDANKDSGAKVIFEKDPVKLVQKVIKLSEK